MSVQDPVILTLIRVRFLLALGVLYVMIGKPVLATSLFILLGAIVVGLISAAFIAHCVHKHLVCKDCGVVVQP